MQGGTTGIKVLPPEWAIYRDTPASKTLVVRNLDSAVLHQGYGLLI